MQLSGLANWQIFAFLALKNFLIWLKALGLGIVIGVLFHRLLALFLAWLIGFDELVPMYVGWSDMVVTGQVFFLLFLITLVQTRFFLRKVKLAEVLGSGQGIQTFVPFDKWQIFMGVLSIFLIVFGYYLVDIFLQGYFSVMFPVLFMTIVGTFLFYYFAVPVCFNLYRRRKKGCLSLYDTVAWTPFLRQARKQTFSLGFITVSTGVTLTVLAILAITYYSIDERAKEVAPYDFTTFNEQGESFEERLVENGIDFERVEFDFLTVPLNENEILPTLNEREVFSAVVFPSSQVQQVIPDFHIVGNELGIIYLSRVHEMFMTGNFGEVAKVEGVNSLHLTLTRSERFPLISSYFIASYVFVVSDEVFSQLAENEEIVGASEWFQMSGINLVNEVDQERALVLYEETTNNGRFFSRKSEIPIEVLPRQIAYEEVSQSAGSSLFIGILLCLSFLATTTYILFFKQLAELEREIADFQSLIQIGFPKKELLKAIYLKEGISFGIPLLLGIAHSFFAVRAGWVFFGASLYLSFVLTILGYCVVYGVFAYRTVVQYSRVLEEM